MIFNYFILLVTSNLHFGCALKITRLHIPRGASHEAPIDCRYDLENDGNLYAVKWYKDGQEFYRCMADGSVKEFSVPGIKIYHPQTASTGSCPLTLTSISSWTAGDYVCEVSLDSPSFDIVTKSAYLSFIEPSRRTQDPTDEDLEEENEIRVIIPSKGSQLQFTYKFCSLFIFYMIINVTK